MTRKEDTYMFTTLVINVYSMTEVLSILENIIEPLMLVRFTRI